MTFTKLLVSQKELAMAQSFRFGHLSIGYLLDAFQQFIRNFFERGSFRNDATGIDVHVLAQMLEGDGVGADLDDGSDGRTSD